MFLKENPSAKAYKIFKIKNAIKIGYFIKSRKGFKFLFVMNTIKVERIKNRLVKGIE